MPPTAVDEYRIHPCKTDRDGRGSAPSRVHPTRIRSLKKGWWICILLLITIGCGVKLEYLPQINSPYVAEMEFLKEVKNVNGKAKKRRFKDDRISTPFYFLLKIKEIENNGIITVRFYETAKEDTEKSENKAENKKEPPDSKALGKEAVVKAFEFGKPGKYYEYIIFFDRVDILPPGKYRYGVFFNDALIYEDSLEVAK